MLLSAGRRRDVVVESLNPNILELVMNIVPLRPKVLVASTLVGGAILIAMVASAAGRKDTPVPADRQCNFVNYHHNEAKNAKGPGKCASDCDCDGMRSCVSGACTGKARPETLTPEVCNREDYHYRESWTPAGPGKCSGDCECDGLRTCVSGKCQGTAR